MTDNKTHTEDIKKLGELIEGIEFAMLTTVEPDGSLHGRPMATQQVKFDGDLYFFTHASSPKAVEIEHESKVNVAYADPENQKYVSISGTARLSRDRKKMEELWTPELNVWFKDGLDDPDLALLKVTVEQAEYWDSPSSKVARVYGYVKAIVTGQTDAIGENKKINM